VDLLQASWIPWRRRRSGVVAGPISKLTDGLFGDDPVVGIASPRPDFDGALHEFLIGLLTYAFKAADDDEWRERWDHPPTPAELQAALNALPGGFVLDADDGPRFLQDFGPADLQAQPILPIDRLLIDSPGEQTAKDNKTLFVKPARFTTLGLPEAAMALLAMQTYAPAGGQGNRTSMRGGGPLTTLADPRVGNGTVPADEQPLWEMLWFSVETKEQWDERAPSHGPLKPEFVLPWLAATRTSDSKKPPVTPAQAHTLQAYFGMPRRIRLEFGGAGVCGLTGRLEARVVTGFRMKNFGVEYAAWKHPLSPHYLQKGEWLPIHPQPGGVSWKDWPDMTLRVAGGEREAANAIIEATARAKWIQRSDLRMHVFGYDMDNMKARAWVSATQPMFALPTDTADQREWLAQVSTSLVGATRIAANALSFAIKTAWFDRVEDADDPVVPKQRLWAETEQLFFRALRSLVAGGFTLAGVATARRAYFGSLREVTLSLFDEYASIESAPASALRRHVSARYSLTGTLAGVGKLGRSLYEALDLEAPAAATKSSGKSKPRKGVAK